MNHQPHESRRQAAKKFVNALDELETVLTSDFCEADPIELPPVDLPSLPGSRSSTKAPVSNVDDLGQLLDEAVQDIEQFIAKTDSTQKSP